MRGSDSRKLGVVTKIVPWWKKKWAIPLLWFLAIWESEALTSRRFPSISRVASRHPVVAGVAMLSLANHFRRYEEVDG